VAARYSQQNPFVGTPAQRFVIESQFADDGERLSKAEAVRHALDAHYGLVDGHLSEGDERTEAFHAWARRKGIVLE
jgi:hypothetical protein